MAHKQFRRLCLKARDNQHELYDVTEIGEYFEKLRCKLCGITVVTGQVHPARQAELDAAIMAELNGGGK